MLFLFTVQVVSMFPSLLMRVLGIAVASFSSGLGEITFLQLSTIYGSPILGGKAVSWFSSGTGASGLVGALLWWIVRGFGVELGLGLTSVNYLYNFSRNGLSSTNYYFIISIVYSSFHGSHIFLLFTTSI